MASTRIAVVSLFPLVLLSATWATEDICANVKVTPKMTSSASGRWYLIASKKQEMLDNEKIKSMMPKCGGINNALPCSCTVFDIKSNVSEMVPEYNVTSLSYNMTSEKYDTMPFTMRLAENTSNTAIFDATPQEVGEKRIIKYLASDNHQTFMLWLICSVSGEGLDLWFLSRTVNATNESMEEVNKALKNNNLTMSLLFPVIQTNCVYAPGPGVKTRQTDKYRVF
ncbi:uncharacterized protein LOC124366292 [Homalodisca vitripennis]|uniref:uncharacterized protein LOC124366292 n=1 Tax=Homalodisca vitripennis TaxID=197043 RepID=UPI001EEC3E04|nr:uncharacterized protein LOC124366292 [Homalodisca vitripennis]XP_046678672.1 uncharacterized protein LOC124366292 [Homalodisca vitripennis]